MTSKCCVQCGRIIPVGPLSRCPDCYKKYRSSLKPQGSHWAWSKIRAAVLAAEPLCRHCHKTPATIVDHIVERRYGGGDESGNLQPLCHRCHAIKSRSPEAMRNRRYLK